MRFHEFGDPEDPTVVLVHGGGNSWWNYLRQARALAGRYHVVLPTLDGHGDARDVPYTTTEDQAAKLLAHIDERCGGQVRLVAGVSLGGQIVIELLSQRADVAQKAIVDGSLCIPQPLMARCCELGVRLFGGFMFGERACRVQLALMPRVLPASMQFPEEIAARYLEDMPRTPKETLVAMYRTYMAAYELKEGLRHTTAQVQYWYGEKEMRCVKESAQRFQSLVPTCEVREMPGCGHGYLAIYLPDEWLAAAEPLLEE